MDCGLLDSSQGLPNVVFLEVIESSRDIRVFSFELLNFETDESHLDICISGLESKFWHSIMDSRYGF